MDEPAELLPEGSRFSNEPGTKGFDQSAGTQWIYPDNYPLRDYQFNIVKSALYHNTLVCLPTGLGKTFIAAVVMFNFWRWYPMGKIVFLAPTKPLVAQQINACHDIMGIPSEETIELTGSMDQKKRQVAWNDNAGARVIFATPQVFHNDLEKNIVPAELVKCVVVDEAHRALGRHSYCESIRLLSEKSKFFRVLGLSATPGGKLDAVQEVIRNLSISRLELRDDTSPDIIPYINARKVDIILVGLGEDLEKFKDRYIMIMDPHVRVLIQNNVLRGNTSKLSKGRIFHIKNEWQQKPKHGSNHGLITKTLMILFTMYHAYELMIRHGLRAFYNFYQKHEDKFWLSSEHALTQLLEEINYYLGPFPDIPAASTGSFPVIPEGIRFGHNKFLKLKDLLLRHFRDYQEKDEETRAMVFVEFRDIANEVYVLLLQAMPLVRPQKLVGQAGQKRKEQSKALEDFRSNKVNVLISTSVGEEGLDVGEVDLIVCFDTTHVNPTRLVQRMGRTGRKRDGHIIVLATDGKEHETLKSSMSRRDSLNNKVLHSSGILSVLLPESPRMVPQNLQPECRKMGVIVQPKVAGPSKKKGKTKETKKPRKKADTNNKTKNTKNPVPSGSQSLMKFFKRTTQNIYLEDDDEIVDLTIHNVPQSKSQTVEIPRCNKNVIKSSNIKLLTSDDAAVEFLTLCTMKRSQHERTNVDERKTNPYFPSYYEKPEKMDFSFEIPDLKVLECLKTLEPYVEPITNDQNNEESIIHDENEHFRPSRCFDDLYENQNPPSDDNFCDSRFEALLDDTSGDSDKTHFEPLQKDERDYPSEEKVDWGENVSGFQFEDLVDEWSDETRMTAGKDDPKDQNDPNPETKVQISNKSTEKLENFKNVLNSSKTKETKNSIDESHNMEEESAEVEFGNFEQLLNDDSESSSEKNQSNLVDHEASNALSEKTGAFEDLLNDEWEISSEKCDSDATVEGLVKTSLFENLLDDDSTTKSDIDDCREKIVGATGNQETKVNSNKKIDDLENISIPSDDSLTQFDGELNINKQNSQFSSVEFSKNMLNRFDNEIADSIGARDKTIGSRGMTEKINDESIDVLDDFEPRNSQSSNSEKRYFGIISGMSKNSTPKHSKRPFTSLALSSHHDADERGSAASKFVNKNSQGPATSHYFDTESSNSRFRGNDNSRRETQCEKEVDEADEKNESDDDIFGVDDILVDSDFEEQINEIEKSAENDASAIKKGGNIEFAVNRESGENIEIEKRTNFQSNSIGNVEIEKSKNIEVNVNNKKEPNPKIGIPEITINNRSEKSIDSGVLSADKESKKIAESPKLQEPKIRKICDSVLQNSSESKNSSIRVTEADLNLDDCDWDSIDFEVPAVHSRVTTSKKNIVDRVEATSGGWIDRQKTESREVKNSGTSAKATGWLSTEKPQSRLSLSKKLSRNICNSFWSEKKEKDSGKRDSDSENDFTVLRLETTISKDFDDDCFSKPEPVSAIRKPQESPTMSRSIKSLRRPLSLKRDDVNNLEGSKLSIFAAPSKYKERETNKKTDNDRKLGVGKLKSVSCNLDSRKRKKVQMHSNAAKRLRPKSDFIDDEAEVSSDCEASSGSSGCDDDLDGFVSYTQNDDDHVDMQAHYLQTIRSPRNVVGGFYFKKTRNPSPDLQIYSQPLPDEPNHYINDSFCVDEEDEVYEDSVTSGELTRLEELELRLKSKKRKRTESAESRANRKRKVRISTSDATSSEDETENLRRQILEESFALKNKHK